MRNVIKEPGFWMMVFAVIILAMLLFAPDARCEEQVMGRLKYTVDVELVCDSGVSVDDLSNCKPVYYHYVEVPNKSAVLVHQTEKMPEEKDMYKVIIKYLMAQQMGG